MDPADQLIEDLDATNWGPVHRALCEQLLALAHERNDEDLEFEARMRLTAEGVMSDITELTLTNFAWCIAKHKEDPARFVSTSADSSDSIFWHYKWMPGTLMASPAFPMDQVAAVLDDFEQTYKTAGLPMSAVVGARFETAIAAHDLDEARVRGAELSEMPRDRFSSCEACTPSNFVELALLERDHQKAATLALSIWKDGKSCAEEPESLLASALLSMAMIGKKKKAIKAFHYVYEASRSQAQHLANIAQCVLFAAVTGNEERALALIERHLPWFAHDALSERAHVLAARNFAVALSRLEREGQADVVVRGSADPRLNTVFDPADAPRTVSELAAQCWAVAERLSAAFDARHGNDGYATLLAEARELVDVTYPIHLPDVEGDSFRPLLVRRSAPSNAAEWLDKAIDHRWAGEPGPAFEAATYAVIGLEGRRLVRAHGIQRTAAQELGDQELYAAATRDWIAALESSYDADTVAFAKATDGVVGPDAVTQALAAHPHAHAGFVAAAWGAAANSLLQDEGTPEILAQAEDLVGRAIEAIADVDDDQDAHDRTLTSALQFLAQIKAAAGDTAGAIEALDEASELAASRAVLAVVTDIKAQVYGRSEALDAAAALHDEAAELAAAAGHPAFAARAAANAGSAWSALGEPAEAATRFAYALSLQSPGEVAPVSLRWRYAMSALESGDAGSAAPFIEDVVKEETAAGADAWSLGDSHFQLGRAYDALYDRRCADEYLAAAELFAQAGDSDSAAVAGLHAGRELHYTGRGAEAAAVFERALAGEAVRPPLRLDLMLGLASALIAQGDSRWADILDGAVAAAEESGEADLVAKAMFMRLSMLDDEAENPAIAARVIELADAVTARLADMGDPERASHAQHWKANALLALERQGECEALLARLARDESLLLDVRRQYAARLADHLREWGRDDDADQWKAYRKQLKQ